MKLPLQFSNHIQSWQLIFKILFTAKQIKKICQFDSSNFRSRELLTRETYKSIVKCRFMAGTLLEEPVEEELDSDGEEEKKKKQKE